MESVQSVLRDITQVKKEVAYPSIHCASPIIIWVNAHNGTRVMKFGVESARYRLQGTLTVGQHQMEYALNAIRVSTIILMNRHAKGLILSVRQQTKRVEHALVAIQDTH